MSLDGGYGNVKLAVEFVNVNSIESFFVSGDADDTSLTLNIVCAYSLGSKSQRSNILAPH